MAISLKTAGSWARVVADPSSVTIPGTPAAGDRMFLFANWKDYAITVANPSGWTPIVNSFADGTTGAGNGTGSVSVAAWYRDWQSGDGNPSLNWSASPTEAHAVVMLWQKGASDAWVAPTYATAAIAANDPFSATASTTLTIADGAVVMCMVALRDDSTTIARGVDDIDDDGSPTVTWNGNYVESPATHFSSTTGLDMSGDLGHRLVTTGAAGVNLTTAGNPAAAETGSALWVHQSLRIDPSGTGAITVPAATVSGTGSEILTATGAITVPAATVSGTGAEVFTSTGAVTVPAATVSGTGAEVFTATGSVTVPAPTVSGTGTHEGGAPTNPEGTGAISVPAATVAGTGSLVLTATGSITIPAATVSGTGAQTFTATGAVTVQAPTIAGTGSHAGPVTGTGSITASAATVSGSGTHRQNVTGTGAITAPAATVAGTGTGPSGGRGGGRAVAPDDDEVLSILPFGDF